MKRGWFIVSPRAISASMSWITAFMRAIAKVAGLISWPKTCSGSTSGGSFNRPFVCTPRVSRRRRWDLISRPPEPQQGSYAVIPGSGSSSRAIKIATSRGV